jgi:regulator of protease activity HflC (stomatin/prohibitin superfamily)
MGHGWASYLGSGDNSHLPEETQRQVEQRMKEQRERRGQLLAVVEVRVYENEAHAQISCPQGARLRTELDTTAVAQVVARARRELAGWR